MRSALRVLAFGGLAFFGAPGAGWAEWQFAPLVGYTFGGATTLIDFENAAGQRHWNVGGAVTVIGDSPFGVEALIVYTSGFFQRPEALPNIEARVTASRAHALMGNAVLATPRAWNRYGLRPYLSGGIGRLHVFRNDVRNIVPIRLDLVGMNLGGGATGFFTDRVGVRFDLRYFRKIHGPAIEDVEVTPTLGEPIRLRYWTTMVGVVLRY